MRSHAHPRLGDVTDRIDYRYDDSSSAPERISISLFERDQDWTLEAHRVSMRRDVDLDSLRHADVPLGPPQGDEETRADLQTLNAIAPGLWSIEMEDLDSRSLVAEFKNYVVVMEAAVSSANGERIVRAVKRQFPGKPIRHFLFSHHHPHYLGGLRAFIAEGSTIVTTPGNAKLVTEIATYPFTLAPDRLAAAPRTIRSKPFDHRFELKDGTNHLVAVDIGARSDHTDEFVVFWFPKQKVLFETEQGWVTVDGKLRASRRAEGFLKALKDEGIEPARLVQSWPMRGNRAELTRAELDSLILARKR